MNDEDSVQPSPAKKQRRKCPHGPDTERYVSGGKKTGCKQCVKDARKQSSTAILSKPCQYHPYNTVVAKDGYRCACCLKETNMVGCAKFNDERFKRGESTLTIDYIRSCAGKQCRTCGIALFVLPGKYDLKSLSMHRLDNSKPHDCDPNQTVASCLQCNVWQNTWTDEEFYNVLDHAASDFDITTFEIVSIPSRKRNRSIWGKDVLRCCKNRRRAKNITFSYTYDEFKYRYEDIQRGRCFACGLLLGEDVSFDRTLPSAGYTSDNITLMHFNCNAGKLIGTLEMMRETAKRSVSYRAQRRIPGPVL